ncbi:MAG: outer membrane lipoprotein carrier protein LolA [Bacteroidales bacterium]|nr:outer membrane lipoprotein carrier protein LolA [Bacteroidales bacterium]
MKFIIPIFSLFVGLVIFAQDPVEIQDPKADPYLKNISKDLKTESPYRIEFKYEIYSLQEDAKVSDNGTIIIHDEKYQLKTEDTEVYYNGQTLWSYNIMNEEVYQSEPEEGSGDKLFSDPFRLLANYNEYFKYRFLGEKNINAQKLIEIDLYPKDLETPYSMIKLFTTTDKSLYSINIKQKNGIDLKIFITKITHNINISESDFSWDEASHSNVLLIEM